LIDTEDGASGLGGGLENIDSDLLGLPDELLVHIIDVALKHVDTEPHSFLTALGVLLSELVEDVSGVEAGVLGEGSGDGLESLGKSINDELSLARDLLEVLSEVARELHFDGASTGHNGVRLDGSTHNHGGIVEGPLSLLEILLSTSSEHEGGRLGLLTASEHVVSLVTKLDLLELAANSEHVRGESLHGGLKDSTGSLGNTGHIILLDSTGAEDVSVGEVLGGEITNGEVREDNLGSGVGDFVKLVVDDVPLSINNLLEIIGVVNSNLSVVLLSLELELDVEEGDLRVFEALGLLLETGIGEGLLEADTSHHEGVGDRATSDLLDSDVSLIEVLIQVEDGVDDHLGEELLVLGDNLGVEGSLSALDQELLLLLRGLVADLHGNLFNSLQALLAGLAVAAHNDLAVHALVDESLGLLQKLTGGDNDRGSSISDFVVLGLGDVHKGLGSGVHNIEEADQSGAIIRNSHAAAIVDELVHASGTKSGLDDFDDRLAGIDVRDDVALALGLFGSVLKDEDLRCL